MKDYKKAFETDECYEVISDFHIVAEVKNKNTYSRVMFNDPDPEPWGPVWNWIDVTFCAGTNGSGRPNIELFGKMRISSIDQGVTDIARILDIGNEFPKAAAEMLARIDKELAAPGAEQKFRDVIQNHEPFILLNGNAKIKMGDFCEFFQVEELVMSFTANTKYGNLEFFTEGPKTDCSFQAFRQCMAELAASANELAKKVTMMRAEDPIDAPVDDAKSRNSVWYVNDADEIERAEITRVHDVRIDVLTEFGTTATLPYNEVRIFDSEYAAESYKERCKPYNFTESHNG